jgi:hypothetical protein
MKLYLTFLKILMHVNVHSRANDLSWDPRRHEYDVFPDGQRFIFCFARKAGQSPINVILNWEKLSSSQPILEQP